VRRVTARRITGSAVPSDTIGMRFSNGCGSGVEDRPPNQRPLDPMADPKTRASPRGNAGGPQDAACLPACSALSAAESEPGEENAAPVGPSPQAPAPDLSVAVRECRKRVALDDIWHALSPVSRHSDAAMLCLELEDIDGIEHHLRRVVDGARTAAKKFGELKKHLQVSA
jgi:hypothetical protein